MGTENPRPVVDAYASQPHYWDYINDFWQALPESVRGTFYVGPAARREGERTQGVPPGGPIILAGHPDFGRARGRPVILVEHGAGETWGMTSPSYPGGPGRERVILFLCPNQRVADANGRYGVPTPIVGSPRLEWLSRIRDNAQERNGHRRVVVSFHWENSTWQHTRSAYLHYREALSDWASQLELRGHGHPRWIDKMADSFGRAGIPTIGEFSEVVEWADVYAVDNSSTLFEAAALGLDVIMLNAPWYSHFPGSLRFDLHDDIGPQVNSPSEFVDAVNHTHVSYAEARRRMVTEIFGAVDMDLATKSILEAVTNGDPRAPSSNPGSSP